MLDRIKENSPIKPEELSEEFDDVEDPEDAKHLLSHLIDQGYINENDVKGDISAPLKDFEGFDID